MSEIIKDILFCICIFGFPLALVVWGVSVHRRKKPLKKWENYAFASFFLVTGILYLIAYYTNIDPRVKQGVEGFRVMEMRKVIR